MSGKNTSKFGRVRAIIASFLVLIGLMTGVGTTILNTNDTYAVPDEGETTSETTTENNSGAENAEPNSNSNNNSVTVNGAANSNNVNDQGSKTTGNSCKDSLGALGWVVCPSTGKISEAVDWLYDKIEQFLVVSPISTEDGSPIYEIWKYCRGLTNIVFIIFLLVVIYSQLTGFGISNYGLKKVLPKLIVTAVLVNLSFLICSLAVDVSNIVGNSLRGVFTSVEETTLATSTSGMGPVSLSSIFNALVTGGTLAIGAGAIAFEFGMIWMLIPIALGAIVAVVTGLITIALRQAVVALLIMISPLAMVAYMLPNTEQWFKKWKDLLTRMLVFYPMFSLLFGASSLAGFAIIMSAKDGFGLLLGVAVQLFPLFFAWKLMQMSGTFLSGINAKLRGLADKPLAGSRAWADSKRQISSANRREYGKTPMSHLRRFMDNRRALDAKQLENLQTIQKNRANVFVQKKISAGYDGSKSQGTSEYLKANKYTRTAKDASTSGLLSETATMDTVHTLSNYGDYYVDETVRERIKVAEKAGKKGKALAEQIRLSDPESRRNAAAAGAFLEYSRAQMTAENDNESDFNFMVKEYLDSLKDYDPNDKSDKFSKYKHYIMSSAGGLGEAGQTRVLGKIIARAAAVESSQRRDINIIAAKYPHDKTNFRNMFVGYYVNDDGYATDKEGNRLKDEKYRGYLLKHHPEKLVKWDQIDEQGRKYYDWYDGDQFVTRIYETDGSAFKELFSNQDVIINDPINNLYGMLAGMEPGKDGVPEHIGLKRFRTTIGRGLLAAPFKDKNAAFSPMVAEMIKKGYIQNYTQEFLAYLDSLNKATKPGAFNVQDADAIKMFQLMMNPEKWPELFPEELLRGFRNVNGELISGFKLNDDGTLKTVAGSDGKKKPIKVPNGEATYDELMACVKEKYIIPAARKITLMMSRQTPNTADNQKAGTIEEWKKLKDVFDTKWGKGKMFEVDPYEQKGDMRRIAKEVRESLHEGRFDSSVFCAEVDDMYMSCGADSDEFARSFVEYCDNVSRDYPDKVDSIKMVKDNFDEYIRDEQAAGRYPTTDDLKDKMEELIHSFINDD